MDCCKKCVADKKNCDRCKHNPKYRDYPHTSYFMEYKPTCPIGYTDCVCDPAYIKFYHPEWYKKLYGDKSPQEAAESCRKNIEQYPDEEDYCYDYDNEDK